LANDEWKEDILPEILNGHNVADFLDPDILERCEELEREEGLRLEEEAAQDAFMIDGHDELTEEQREILGKIRKKKAMLIQEHRMKKSTAESRPIVPRKHDKDRKFTTKRLGRQLSSMGVDPTAAVNRIRSQSRGRKRDRSLSRADGDDMEVYGQHSAKKLRTRSRSRSQ
jgi:nucleolar GTP-binding protein